MRSRVLGVALVLAQVAPQPALADDIAKADALFAEGRALMKTDLHAACAKFEESLKWNSQAIGTLLNVALCDEKLGRVASAVAKFTEARDRAREGALDEHLQAAEERLAALKGRVPFITIKLATEPLPGTRILIHDKVIALEALADLPIDPGEHPLVVSAPDHVPYQTTIKIAESERREVVVPALRKGTVTSSRKTIGKIVTISGGVALVGGIVIGGVIARGRYNDAFDMYCDDDDKECDPDGLSGTKSARTLGTVGTVVGAIGLVGVGVGLYLWLRAPDEGTSRGVSLLPQLDPSAPGVVAVGRF
ncbi:MAG: hypothetical protein H0T46_07035 [Deltaproteobacteria bacterium]|nr:hypothetical protein [Deltaproteobacteria bacterium]